MNQTSLVFRFFKAEHAEIDRLKWIESEKVGHDIGADAALIKWNLNYRTAWATYWLAHNK